MTQTQTQDLLDAKSQWDSCHLRGVKDKVVDTQPWESIRIKHAFDSDSLRDFCVETHFTTCGLFQAAWAVVLGTYTANDEICSGFIPRSQTSPLAIYRTKVDGRKPAREVLKTLEPKQLVCALDFAQGLKIMEEVAQSSALFDTCLSMAGCDTVEGKNGEVCLLHYSPNMFLLVNNMSRKV
jgi:hypothetical protein